MIEELELIERTVTFHDEPLQGYARDSHGGLFAFRRVHVIPDRLIHWILLPVDDISIPVSEVFRKAEARAPERWLSILDDQRGPTSVESVAEMDATAKIPLTWD